MDMVSAGGRNLDSHDDATYAEVYPTLTIHSGDRAKEDLQFLKSGLPG